MIEFPPGFAHRVKDAHGPLGETWLEQIPSSVHLLKDRWALTAIEPFMELNYHFVADVVRSDGSQAVLKLGLSAVEIEREAECLRIYAGDGAPVLFAADAELGALLLERAQPGHDLTALEEEQAIDVVCSLMRRLHMPLARPTDFPTIADWGQGFGRLRDRFAGKTGPFPAPLFARAEDLFWGLHSSMAAPVLLHGDLHHGNVLAADRLPWLAIDPQGVIGEPCYEVGAFLRNPTPAVASRPDLRGLLARRVALFSDALDVDRQRIAGWGLAQAVLSAIWSLEDHGAGWEPALTVAAALQANLH